ncbi:hypothetical protein PTNB29_09483 [Pyrenophora teres f. teres]|nr:hypothetical protein PTNB29_09483 [Pyrenophora teres f. teres]
MAPTAPTHDYYAVLEVRPDVLYDEIRTSYRRLARLHHPDKNVGRGSEDATLRTQIINLAWEVLGDTGKRTEYDRSRPRSAAERNNMAKDTHAATPKATSTDPPTPGYRPPPSPPNTAAEEQARAEALSKAKRQEWLDYEKQQEQKIREYRNIVKLLETEILALTSKIDENKAKLAESSPQKLPDLNMDTINASNAIRIKQAYLDKETARLKRLGNELEYRQACEEARLALEQHFAKHAWASQTRAARATAEHEMQERARRQQSERFQKWQAQEQERKRKRKQEETAGSGVGEQQDTAQEPERKTRARPKSTQAAAFAAFLPGVSGRGL